MNWKKILLGGGLIAAAPFTGGLSLPLIGSVGAGLAAGGAGTLASGLLGGKKPAAAPGAVDPTATAGAGGAASTDLKSSADDLSARGKGLGETGDAALKQVVDHYSKLLSGDADAVAAATEPERARVIDQYDTARDAITKFSGRGGGTTSASAFSRIAEANEMADITGRARAGAASGLAQIGTQEQGLGLSADQLSSTNMQNTIQNALAGRGLDLQQQGLDLTKRGQNIDTVSGVGKAIGDILGLILTRKKASA